MKFSRTLAIAFGFLAPLADTVRRWQTWRDFPPALFDDYLIGALLLAGAWLVGRNFHQGQRLLAAAWGFTCGLGYCSFFSQLQRYQLGEIDPAPISSRLGPGHQRRRSSARDRSVAGDAPGQQTDNPLKGHENNLTSLRTTPSPAGWRW